mgnify:CR=1 FL=1
MKCKSQLIMTNSYDFMGQMTRRACIKLSELLHSSLKRSEHPSIETHNMI